MNKKVVIILGKTASSSIRDLFEEMAVDAGYEVEFFFSIDEATDAGALKTGEEKIVLFDPYSVYEAPVTKLDFPNHKIFVFINSPNPGDVDKVEKCGCVFIEIKNEMHKEFADKVLTD
jgi:hypothetical protein